MRVWIEIVALWTDERLSLFHPLMRVWIEIINMPLNLRRIKFHPLMRVWIEILNTFLVFILSYVSPSYEGVD